jgi:hypothetical protein
MTLFKPSDIFSSEKSPQASNALLFGEGKSTFPLMKLKELFGKIQPEHCMHYQTDSSFSTHDILQYCLMQSGGNTVYLTTWSISEDVARMLFTLKEKGLIHKLYCLLNDRVRTQNTKAFYMLQNLIDEVGLAPCHAKVFVIEGGAFPVTVVSSANCNKNIRIEAGVLDTSAGAATFHKGWISEKIKQHAYKWN